MTKASRSWNFINTAGDNGQDNVELFIEGDIIDYNDVWLYDWFGIPNANKNAFREELNKYKGKDITVWIDSNGGSVFAATGMYNALKEHTGKKTMKINRAMSAATIPAMAGDEVLTSIVGITMIHNPVPGLPVHGDAQKLRKVADVLDTVKEVIINAYVSKTGLSRDEIWSMMDEETYMSANVAVKKGFADGILYDEEPIKIDNFKEFNFNRLSVVNSSNKALEKMIELDSINDNSTEEGDDKLEIKNIDDLRNAYPKLVSEIEASAKKAGAEEERNRIKGIEEIQNSSALFGKPDLVAKAKFEEPKNATELAFEALKADSSGNQEYLNNVQADNQDSGVEDIETLPPDQNSAGTKQAEQEEVANDIATSANERRGIK